MVDISYFTLVGDKVAEPFVSEKLTESIKRALKLAPNACVMGIFDLITALPPIDSEAILLHLDELSPCFIEKPVSGDWNPQLKIDCHSYQASEPRTFLSPNPEEDVAEFLGNQIEIYSKVVLSEGD